MFARLSRWADLVRVAIDRQRAIEALDRLDDWQLADIGIVRGMIDDHVRDGIPRPVKKLRAASGRAQPAFGGALVGCG